MFVFDPLALVLVLALLLDLAPIEALGTSAVGDIDSASRSIFDLAGILFGADTLSWAEVLVCAVVLGLVIVVAVVAVVVEGSGRRHVWPVHALSWALSRPIWDFAALTNEVWVSIPTRIRSTSMLRTLQAQLYD